MGLSGFGAVSDDDCNFVVFVWGWLAATFFANNFPPPPPDHTSQPQISQVKGR